MTLKQLSQNRPAIAVLNEDFPKLRESNANDLSVLINYIIIILNIKVEDSQEEIQRMNQQMVMVGDFLRTKFGYLTIPEIQEAFKMYVAREFSHIKVFRILDCPSIGEVLQAYTDFRAEALRKYSQQKSNLLQAPPGPTDEQKRKIREDLLKIIKEDLEANSHSNDAHFLYDELYNAGKIKVTDLEKKILYQKELQKYNSEQRNQIERSGLASRSKLLEELKAKIESKTKILTVQNRCKSILASEYLIRNLEEFEIFKKALEDEKR